MLEPQEIQNLLSELESPFRLMVLMYVTAGLRRSELFALKAVPLSLDVAADLWLWRESTLYAKPNDWIFASPRTRGKKPFWPDMILATAIRPAAVCAGIKRRIGWHTFRHIFHDAHSEWRECEGGSGSSYGMQAAVEVRCLFPIENHSEAKSSTTHRPDDSSSKEH